MIVIAVPRIFDLPVMLAGCHVHLDTYVTSFGVFDEALALFSIACLFGYLVKLCLELLVFIR